ncbi:MAG: CheY-like chemotaxis protein [Flavobacteriales bacterium]|jgi:CheY-like chemotaxis protein
MEYVKTVLLIDDNPSCNFIMSEFIKLADDRIRVFAAESVEEAFQFLESANSFPEVIYVDINMPVQSGFEFIELYERRFRSAHPSSKLFMLSSTLRHEDKAQALEFESVSGFMSKNDIDTFLQKSLLKEFV